MRKFVIIFFGFVNQGWPCIRSIKLTNFFGNKMIKFLRSMFANTSLYANATFIRGDLSAGRQDRPGVWYKP